MTFADLKTILRVEDAAFRAYVVAEQGSDETQAAVRTLFTAVLATLMWSRREDRYRIEELTEQAIDDISNTLRHLREFEDRNQHSHQPKAHTITKTRRSGRNGAVRSRRAPGRIH